VASLVTGTALTNNLTRIAFSSVLHRQTQDKLFFNKKNMVGKDIGGESAFERRAGLPIRSLEALNGKRAQEVRVGLMMQLTRNRTQATGERSLNARTYGVSSSNTMVDQEELAALHNCIAFTEQSKHATSTVTPEIQDLRTEFKVTAQLGGLLTDWSAAEREENTLDAIYYKWSGHVKAGLSQTASSPPTANQKWAGAATDDASLGTSDRLSPAELRRMCSFVETKNISPVTFKGMEGYVLLVHPFNYNDLISNSEIQASLQNAYPRDKKDNPLFGAADFEYAGIYVYKYSRIRASATNPNARRCILLGADAVAEGVTSRPRLVRRKEDDYEDIFGLGIKEIYGQSRFDWAPNSGTTFNQWMAIWGIYTATEV